jgi:hypothetical protein
MSSILLPAPYDVYACDLTVNLTDVPRNLEEHGVAVVYDDHLLTLLTPDVVTAASKAVIDKGIAVFHREKLDNAGRFVMTDEGLLNLDGDMLRMQLLATRLAYLKSIRDYMKPVIKEVLTLMGNSANSLRIQPPVLMGNKTNPSTGATAGAQTLHTDITFESVNSFVVILPFTPDFHIQVAFGSNRTVSRWVSLTSGLKASRKAAASRPLAAAGTSAAGTSTAPRPADYCSSATGAGALAAGTSHGAADSSLQAGKGGASAEGSTGVSLPAGGGSTSVPDDGATSSDDDDDDSLTDTDLIKLSRLLPIHQVLRVVMGPGHILFLRGNTVHAGDAAVQGEVHPRMHWYVHDKPVENLTHLIKPITGLSSRFIDLPL